MSQEWDMRAAMQSRLPLLNATLSNTRHAIATTARAFGRDVAGYVDGMGTPAGEVQRAQPVTRPAVDMGAAVTQQLDDARVAAVARDVDGRNAAVVRHVTKRATAGELWERAMADDEKNAEATHRRRSSMAMLRRPWYTA